jgi:pyrroline-5-carboxylate reductase
VVKPQDFAVTLEEIRPHLHSNSCLISFAAGKSLTAMAQLVGSEVPAIRVMPNTPTLVGLGMAGISPNEKVQADQLSFVVNFLNTAGKAVVVPENLQDAVTATSGSGPAYFFAFVEAMVAGAIKLGLPQDVATTLTVQTLIGAGAMLEQTGLSATKLRENVTSPNGTTAAALATLSEGGMSELVARAMTAAANRSQELA